MAQHLFPSLLPEVCMLHSEHSDFIPSVQHPLLNSFGKHLSGEKKKKKSSRAEKQFCSPSKALNTGYLITDTNKL